MHSYKFRNISKHFTVSYHHIYEEMDQCCFLSLSNIQLFLILETSKNFSLKLQLYGSSFLVQSNQRLCKF